ncbi:MAG: sigma-70 family RNA polymerase sigma factor [Armatimonadota bacterium]
MEHDNEAAERRIVSLLASGDGSALGELYALYAPRIYRYTYRMLNNAADAEDATQETFYRVMRKSRDLRADAAFRTWIFRIARNLCIDRIRQQPLVDLPMDATVGAPEDQTALQIAVRQALNELPQEYREPLILCDVEEITANEAAEILDLSVPALKSRLYRGRRALKERLGPAVEEFPREKHRHQKSD